MRRTLISLTNGQELYLSARCIPPQAWHEWCPQHEKFFEPATGGNAIGRCEELGWFVIHREGEKPNQVHTLIWAETPEEFIPESDLVSDLCVYGSYYISPENPIHKLHTYVVRNSDGTTTA